MKHITILANITDLKQSLKPKRKKKTSQMLIFLKKITTVPSLRTSSCFIYSSKKPSISAVD